MKLQNALTKKLVIEERIYEQDGEIDFLTDLELQSVEREIAESLDAVVLAYKRRKSELEELKDLLKGAVATRTRQLDFFNRLLFDVAKSSGDLKTPLTSLAVRSRTSKRVVITDFDLAARTFPQALTIHVEDNVKKLTLSKTYLKEIYENAFDSCEGFKVEENVSEFVDARVRVKK